MKRAHRIAFWTFLAFWTLTLFFNKAIGAPTCWFYSDKLGEYSFSEMLSAFAYLLTAILLYREHRKRADRLVLAAAAFNVWLMLEEINYGQVFLNASPTNYYFDEEQLSLHTSFLRPVSLGMPFDMAGLAAFVLHLAVVTIVPAVLRKRYKSAAPVYALALPLALSAFACVGRWQGFLVPWGCGRDSADEITETLLATSTVYFAALFLASRHFKGGHGAPASGRSGT